MTKKKHLKVLFIGNSHTYYHDLPAWVALMAREEGYDCDVTMLAHGGWYLRQHVKEPDVRFNIKFGNYDYVVLQEHSHPFDDIPGYIEAATTLSGWIRGAGSTPVIYGTWARKTEKHVQETMNKANRKLAQDLDALYAPVGESWWRYKESWPEIEMYDEDGAHASQRGIEFAAKIIWDTIETDRGRQNLVATILRPFRIIGPGCGRAHFEDPMMKKVRQLDKLIDELAKGKPMAKIKKEIPQ